MLLIKGASLSFSEMEPADIKLNTSLYSDALFEHEKRFPEVKRRRGRLLCRRMKSRDGTCRGIKASDNLSNSLLKIKRKLVTEHF